jgi:site-specific recombinase XerD
MSKVNYYLKNIPSEEKLEKLKADKLNRKTYNKEINLKRPVLVSIAFSGKREIFATGKFVSLKFWDRDSKRVKALLETPPEMITDGIWLDKKKAEVEKFLTDAISDYRSVSKNDLHELILGAIRTSDETNSLDETLKKFVLEHKTSAGASIKPNTKKVYGSVFSHIKTFQNHDQFKPELYTTSWLKLFKKYLLQTAELNDNTVGKYLRFLATFLKYAKKEGMRINAEFDGIKVSEKEQTVIVLQQNELKILEDIILESSSHDQIRDVFLYQCYTGARYSDIEVMKREDISVTKNAISWNYLPIKTGKNITAPIHVKAQKILQKYSHLSTPLPRYSNQAINREIKKIAATAKLSRRVKKIMYHDNIPKEIFFSLHEVIATHMCRKTFITISLQLGISELMVRQVSGHRDERSFRRYVNLNNSHLPLICDAWNNIDKAS